MSKRSEALQILERVPSTPEGVRSDKQGDLFFQWTGYTHAKMLESWRQNMNGPKLLTACGGFASKFAGLMGITDIESFFDLEKSLRSVGKGHAWVPASSRLDPQIGDILRHTKFHVDVAAGWKKRRLIRVAAGQSSHPRPARSVENEYDALKWVTGDHDYNPANLQGWLDLEKYFTAAPSVGPAVSWLSGWWRVWDGNTYWYHFAPNGVVKYTKQKPVNFATPPHAANNVGSFNYTAPTLVVTWNKIPSADVSCKETFWNAAPGCTKMNAYSNLYGPLEATKV